MIYYKMSNLVGMTKFIIKNILIKE